MKHLQAGWPAYRDETSEMLPQAIFNNCQNNKIVPAERDEIFSYKHMTSPSHFPSCLSIQTAPKVVFTLYLSHHHMTKLNQDFKYERMLRLIHTIGHVAYDSYSGAFN